jgi:hypothetical protein
MWGKSAQQNGPMTRCGMAKLLKTRDMYPKYSNLSTRENRSHTGIKGEEKQRKKQILKSQEEKRKTNISHWKEPNDCETNFDLNTFLLYLSLKTFFKKNIALTW